MKNIKTLSLSSFFILSLALAFLTLAQTVSALGQMSEPIVVENAIRGEKIQKEMIVVNSDSFDVSVVLTAEGDISDWTTFYLSKDSEDTISEIVIPAKENLRLTVVFALPEDAPSDTYKGLISVTNLPPDEEEQDSSITYVRQKINREVSITISDGDELIDIEKSSIIPHTYDLDIDEPLSIRIIYDNQGNISLKPQLRLTINRNEKPVHDLIYPYPTDKKAVNSLSQLEVNPIVVQTNGWEEGRYQAILTFSHGEETILKKDFVFSIAADKADSEENGIISVGNIDKRLLALFGAIILVIFAIVIKKFVVRK